MEGEGGGGNLTYKPDNQGSMNMPDFCTQLELEYAPCGLSQVCCSLSTLQFLEKKRREDDWVMSLVAYFRNFSGARQNDLVHRYCQRFINATLYAVSKT